MIAKIEPETSTKCSQFNQTQFLRDIRKTSAAIGAPYDEAATLKVLSAYSKSFHTGAVLWRATDRSGDALNYRFYERHPTDTVSTAEAAGFLSPGNELGKLVTSWSSLYDGVPEQSCDFDAKIGLVKAWVYMKGMRPLDDILSAPGVPETIRRHGRKFHDLGLKFVRHVAVDYKSATVNLYFRAVGPISMEQATRFNELANSPPPSEEHFEEMLEFLNPVGYTFAVTMKVETGNIERVGYYALKLGKGKCPVINDQLVSFFENAPSYDIEEMNAIAWSFGKGGRRYVKAERSYCGELVPLMKEWSSTFSS